MKKLLSLLLVIISIGIGYSCDTISIDSLNKELSESKKYQSLLLKQFGLGRGIPESDVKKINDYVSYLESMAPIEQQRYSDCINEEQIYQIQKNRQLIAKGYVLSGDSMYYSGDYTGSISIFKSAISLFIDIQEQSFYGSLTYLHKMVGRSYMLLKDYTNAEIHYKKSIEYGTMVINNKGEILYSLIDLGDVSYNLGLHTGALDYYNRAILVSKDDKQKNSIKNEILSVNKSMESLEEFKKQCTQGSGILTKKTFVTSCTCKLDSIYKNGSCQKKKYYIGEDKKCYKNILKNRKKEVSLKFCK